MTSRNRDRDIYGTWAAGATYKASFHDGFTFYPLLGTAYPHNLPLHWATTAVSVGGETVAHGSSPRPRRVNAQRVEFDHGHFLEAYDVRPAGIEQSFVFERSPGGTGDLVVTGRIATELVAAPIAAGHQELLFRDLTGAAILRYGRAFAIDAAGRRTDVTTAWNGQQVELRIDHGFLAEATYPVTLDPLIARVNLDTSTAPVQDVDVIRAPAAGSSKLMTVYSRVFAGNDVDSYARVTDAAFGSAVMVFSDVNASWSTKGGRCTWVGDAQRFAAVFERESFAPTTSSILTYFHLRDDTGLNTGSSSILAKPAGTTARNPDIGGRRAGGGQNAFVVYQTDPTTTQQNTVNTEVWGVLVDAPTAGAASTPTTLDWFAAGTTYDREHPTVVKLSDGQPGFWIVAWHELFRPSTPDDWDVNVTRVRFDGQKMAQRYRLGLGAHPWNKRFPKLAGGNDRFMLTLTFGPNSADPTAQEVHVQRFDWPDSEWDPILQPPQILAADAQTPDFAFPKIAFDSTTRSHWAVTYQRGLGTNGPGDLFVARLGPAGGILESGALFTSPTAIGGATAITFAPENGGSFPIVYGTDEPGEPLFGTALLYPPGAQNSLYGTSCGGQIDATSPYAGSSFFTVSLTGAQPNLPAALAVSGSPWNLSLGPAAPGCFVNVALPAITVNAPTGSLGTADVTIAIPESLPTGFQFYFQWFYIDPTANAAGVSATSGLRSQYQ
ncbi:MAG: hypothetical protein NXI31_20550 [bacterium]|nr:hypothetical protein [bacterium]